MARRQQKVQRLQRQQLRRLQRLLRSSMLCRFHVYRISTVNQIKFLEYAVNICQPQPQICQQQLQRPLQRQQLPQQLRSEKQKERFRHVRNRSGNYIDQSDRTTVPGDLSNFITFWKPAEIPSDQDWYCDTKDFRDGTKCKMKCNDTQYRQRCVCRHGVSCQWKKVLQM